MSEPATTKALLIGIEKYDAGASWNLNGPAKDVLRMAEWLCKQGVPPQNLTIFLSPPDDNAEEIEKAQKLTGQKPVNPTEAGIRAALDQALQEQSASLFLFYWGGHGWITQEGERRLFYADATDTNLKNLDFNDQLVALRSDLFRGIPQQLFVVDTYANYITNTRAKPPKYETPKGEPLSSHQQFVLVAAKPGDLAKNLNAEQTGLYTRELLTELDKLPPGNPWPPELEAIAARLQKRFSDLRAQRLTEQTPAYIWNRDWNSNEKLFAQMPVASPSRDLPPVNPPGNSDEKFQDDFRDLSKAACRYFRRLEKLQFNNFTQNDYDEVEQEMSNVEHLINFLPKDKDYQKKWYDFWQYARNLAFRGLKALDDPDRNQKDEFDNKDKGKVYVGRYLTEFTNLIANSRKTL